ncbi:MAG: 7-carboxy-7-deazaguanine synthase QueE, partial [Candidatus Saganbacteria bacterium]|nr:7-carboxy-7-deazaguanine synthase QueE [Candidatus Saganbacteria bacterium]
MTEPKANLFEIFSSVQGEGLYLGERHLFIRFAGCNLACQYCDTPLSRQICAECRVEQTPGGADFKKIKNPLNSAGLLEIVSSLNKTKNLHSAITLTGGEPLLQIDFLLKFLAEFKKQGESRVYLETNGTLPKHMDEAINYVDVVSMDIKLPSVTGQSAYFKEHHE